MPPPSPRLCLFSEYFPLSPAPCWTTPSHSATIPHMPTRRKNSKAKPAPSSRTRKPPATVRQYLAAVPEPQRTTLQAVRASIRAVLPPDATELISYGIPAFKHKQVVVWFAAFANHCSFFPTAAVISQFRNDLKPYTLSKGTIQFPVDKPLPATLIKKMVRARLAHIDTKTKG